MIFSTAATVLSISPKSLDCENTLIPSKAAVTSSGPVSLVSLPTITRPAFPTSIFSLATMSSTSAKRSSLFASCVAYGSHTWGSISPNGSTSLTPLSCGGLCEAVIMTPMVFPSSLADLSAARTPTLNTVESNCAPSVLNPAVPYANWAFGGFGWDLLAAKTGSRDIVKTNKQNK
ncbi:hypothetical protein OGAPHI_006580 [Ogataea philodendri]|uniref:Uncharacterized protein n=1 Tax=Ogataea philodendri TaxID=1378263 RepID=A0A9P8SZY5_9ASCO|nr:uncharacterized protein OGAPHI_006580 [Ogataea philodendri]KAH3661173.1 hypothetical protein OGAPHI_006580 [Ogataea philodendri]